MGSALTALIAAAGPALGQTVQLSDSSDGVDLDSYSGDTANIASGVSIADTSFTVNCSTFSSLCATSQAWTVTNAGSIGPASFGDGVHLTAGGTVRSTGSIDGFNGVSIAGAAGTVENQTGGTIYGQYAAVVIGSYATPVSGSVTNAGSIASDNADTIAFYGDASVINQEGALIQGHGGSNAVAMLPTGTHTVTNSGVIQSNDSGYGTGVAIGGGTVTNNASGSILGAYNGIWATRSTQITNDGLIEASLAAGSGSAIELDAGGSVANSGTIRSNSTNGTDAGISFTGAGSVTNSGTIESLGGGRAILFRGSGEHSLILDTGSVLGGAVQGGSGADHLVLMGSGSETLDRFTSFETLDVQGVAWSLDGAGGFSSSADLSSGSLSIEGELTSPTFAVASGAVLGGNGTIVANVTNNGDIAPGDLIGTLTINGDYIQAAGSTYTVETDQSPAADLIDVSGTATIEGGSGVEVVTAPGLYDVGHRYTILSAGGGVSGTFSTLTDDAPFTDFALAYDANDVYLDVTRSSVGFEDIAETANQSHVAVSVEELGSGNAVFDPILSLDDDGARQAFDLLSGDAFASTRTALFEDSRYIRNAVLGRLVKRDAAQGQFSGWVEAFGDKGRTDGDGNAATLDRDVHGIVLGEDAVLAPGFQFGVAGAYRHDAFDVNERNASSGIDSFELAVYGGFERQNLSLRAGVASSWHHVSSLRAVDYPGFSGATNAAYHGNTLQAFGEAAYRIGRGQAEIEPFGQVGDIRVRTEGFSEAGSAAALTVARSTADGWFSILGVRGAVPVGAAEAHATVGWRHAYGDLTPVSALSFRSGGAAFEVTGAGSPRDQAVVQAGFDFEVTPTARLSLSYDGQFGSGSYDHAVVGSLDIRF